MKHKEMKEKMRTEYFRRVRKILKSKLNSSNMIQEIDSGAVSLIRYGAGIIKWIVEELKEVDRKTRKLLNNYRALHPQADVDRLYLKSKEGGRGLISVEDCVEMEKENLFGYIRESKERLLVAVRNEGFLSEESSREVIMEKRKAEYKGKDLHGQFERATEQVKSKESWNWLTRGNLKKETEGTIMAAQDQALQTNVVKHRIDGQEVSPMCRLCREREETVRHIVAECKKLHRNILKCGDTIRWPSETLGAV